MNTLLSLVDGLSASWTEAMCRALWQSTLLAGIVLVLTWLLRSRQATVRYWLWMLVPLRLLVVPLVTLPLPVLPPASEPILRPVPTVRMTPALPCPADVTPEPMAAVPLPAQPLVEQAGTPALQESLTINAPTETLTRQWPSVPACLLIAWASGVLFLGIRLLSSWLAMRRFVRHSIEIAEPRTLAVARQVAGDIGLVRMPRLTCTNLDISPLVCGWRRPVIILPQTALQAPPEQLRAILAHEMTHLRRNDPLVGWLLAICQLAWYFHPVFHVARRQILLEREIACDEYVLGTTVQQRSTYARALLATVSATATHDANPPLSIGVAESFQQLQRRLTIICSQLPMRAKVSRLMAVLLVVLGLVSVPGIVLTNRASAADAAAESATQPATAEEASAPAPAETVMYRGVVLDPAGKPLADVRVQLQMISSAKVEAQAVTGPDGRFVIGPALALGPAGSRYIYRELVFEHADYATATWSWGEEDKENIRVRMLPAASLAGTIRDPDGKPVVGALVEAWVRYEADASHVELRHLAGYNGQAVTSDAAGAFRFAHLPEGAKVRLTVTHSQYPRHLTPRDQTLTAGQTDVKVSLAAGVPVGVQLTSQREPFLRQGIFVVAMHDSPAERRDTSWRAMPPARPVQTTTDAQGYAPFVLEPGRYTFVAIGKVLNDLSLVCVPIADVDIASGRPENLELNLVPGQVVAGRLVDAAKRPVIGQDVSVQPENHSVWVPMQWGGFDWARTDDQGRFRLRLPEGSHRLTTRTIYAGAAHTATRLVATREGAPPQEIDWTVGARPRIRGRLVDSQGRGMAGVIGPQFDAVKTDTDGAFVFDDPTVSRSVLAPVPVFAMDAAGTLGKALLIQPGQGEQTLTVTLEPLASVTGRLVARKSKMVFLSEDRPATDATLEILISLAGSFQQMNRQKELTTVSPDGRFTIRQLPTGIPMTLQIAGGAYEEVNLPLEGLAPGATLDVKDVILRPNKQLPGGRLDLSASIGGRVIDETGKGVGGQEVWIYSPGIGGSEAWTDTGGHFEVKGLPAKAWIWCHVRSEGYGHLMFPVWSGTKDAELKIVPPGYAWLGKSAPALLAAKWFDDQARPLTDLRGKVVLLCLGVTVDRPGTFQEMQQWQERYSRRNLAVLAMHQRRSPMGREITEGEIESFLKANQITVPVALDAPSKAAKGKVPRERLFEYGATYSIYGATDDGPTLYLIDKKGILRCSPTRDNLDGWIEKLLAE